MAAASGGRRSHRSTARVRLLGLPALIALFAAPAGATTWTTLPSPSAAEMPMLYGVWAAAPDDLHVVGSCGPSGSDRAVIYHHDGSGWAKTVDSLAGEDVCFVGIWGAAADDIYAISQRRIWHYDGTSWVPQLTAAFELRDIWGSSASDIYVVGHGQMPDKTGLYYHYDGTWQAVDYGLPIASWSDGGDPSGYGGFLEVWGSGPNDVVVMNTRRDLAFCRFARFDGGAWRFCGPGWTDEIQGSKCGLWVSPTGRVFGSLSGDSWWTSYMYTFDGAWRIKTYTKNFGAVWGVADNDVYALDTNQDAPAILHYSGQGWSSVGFSIAEDTRLKNIWGFPSGSHIWVVGGPGTVIHGLGANAVDHFTFSPIGSPQYAGHPFAVTVTAWNASGSVVTSFSGPVRLADSTGTLAPATVTLAGGVGTADLTIAAIADATVISASAEGAHGQSNPFAVAQLIGPDADFTLDCRLGTAPLTVQFTDRSTGTLAGWHWDFGDGATSTERSPVHVYGGNGTFTVTLTVTDAVGNVDTATWTDCITVADLAVAQTFPAAGADWAVSLAPEIWVRFNMGVENVTVNTLVVSYEDELGAPRAVAGTVSSMDQAGTRWSFVPAAPLPRGRRVLVQVMGGATGVRARYGEGVLADGQRFSFSTFPEIRFDVIQVLEGEETNLLTKKPTVVRVATGAFDPTDTPVDAAVQLWIDPPGGEGGFRKAAEVSGSLRDSGACSEEAQKKGGNTTNLFLDGAEWPTGGVYWVRVAILLADEDARLRARTSNQAESPVVVWGPRRRMHVEYVALRIGKWVEMDPQEIGKYRAAASVHSDFVQAVYPVNRDTYRAFIGRYQVFHPDYPSPITAYFDQIMLLWSLHRCAAVDSNIDRVVGVGPLSFLGPAAGISVGGYDGVAVEANARKASLAAHELMHTDGWYRPSEMEEYVMYAPYGRLADPGWWPAKGDDGCRVNVHTSERTRPYEKLDGNSANGPLYYSFMGHADPVDWWVRRKDFSDLLWDFVRDPSLSLNVSPPAARQAQGGPVSGRLALIAGFIMADGTASFEPVLMGGSLDPEAPEPDGAAYYLDFRQMGTLLRRYRLDSVALPADAPIREMFSSSVVVPAATDRIELHRADGRLLGSIVASATAPEVRLIAPNGGESIAEETTVSWTGSDGDGDEIAYSLFYSLDGGASWTPLALDRTATSHQWTTGGLPASSACLVKVVACDGFHTVEDVSDSAFTISEHAPLVAVVEPEEGAVFGLGQAIRLAAAVHDPQGGGAVAADVRWRSDRDGDLGTGESLTVVGLSVGTHHITAETTGATGLIGMSDVLTATVRNNWPPSVRADVAAIGVPGVELSFDPLASDDEGDISLYEWDFDGDGVVDWSSHTAGPAAHAYTAPGVYTAVARVTDAAGGTATDRTSITISAPQTIGGRILNDGLPMPGVPILLSGPFTAAAYTDGAGRYAFHNLTGARYEVTPLMDGFTFLPPAREVVLSGDDSMDNDFAAVQAPPLLEVVRAGNGRVTSTPGGIDCGDICASGYAAGAAVRLTAVPDPGWGFAGWSGGGCRGTDPCVFSMEVPTTVHAVFTTERVPEWVRLVGTWKNEEAFGVALDGVGNSYIAGFTDMGLYDVGVRDMLVAKFDPFGNEVWTRLLGTPAHDTARGITVDAAGNSYVVGYTQESMGGYGDIVTTKLDPNGGVLWTRSLGTPADDRAYGVGIDAAGDCYVAGETHGNLDGQAWAGDADAFVVKYSASGVRQWTRLLGTGGTDIAHGIAVDPAGNSHVTGQTDGNLGGMPNAGRYDAFVAKLTADGATSWTRLLGGPEKEIGFGNALDRATGAVYVSGLSNEDVYGSRQDIFTAKLSADGTGLWTATTGTDTYWEQGSAVAVSTEGSVYTACFSEGPLDGVPNAGWKDVFVIKYDPTGKRVWTRMLGTAESDFALGIAASPEGHLYVAGRTDGPLGGQPEKGNSDAFVWKLVDEAPVPELACSVWPSRHLFAPTAVGSLSPPLVVTVGNRGAADLVIRSLDSSDPAHFVVDLGGGEAPLGSLPVTIPFGKSRTFAVAFAPTAIAFLSGTLVIGTSDSVLPATVVCLGGTGAPEHGPRIAVAPPRLDLRATVAEGNPADVLTLTNTGDMPLAVTGVRLLDGARFSVETTEGGAPLGTLPASIPAGEARTLRLAFGPAMGMDATDVLIVASDDPDCAKIAVPVTGAAPRVPSSGWWLAQGRGSPRSVRSVGSVGSDRSLTPPAAAHSFVRAR